MNTFGKSPDTERRGPRVAHTCDAYDDAFNIAVGFYDAGKRPSVMDVREMHLYGLPYAPRTNKRWAVILQ